MVRRKKAKAKKKRGNTLAGFQRAVKSNASLKAATRALAKATARKKKAYKKAVTAAKKKMRSRR